MTVAEIKKAVDEGEKVYWATKGYEVIKDKLGQYLIVCTSNKYTIGLTWQDGETLNGKEDEFFVERWDVISPDGFSIHPCDTWKTEDEAKQALTEWAKRYEAQGYYSSNRGRINLASLPMNCTVKTIEIYDAELLNN